MAIRPFSIIDHRKGCACSYCPSIWGSDVDGVMAISYVDGGGFYHAYGSKFSREQAIEYVIDRHNVRIRPLPSEYC